MLSQTRAREQVRQEPLAIEVTRNSFEMVLPPAPDARVRAARGSRGRTSCRSRWRSDSFATGWLKGLEVTRGGTRIVSHARLTPLRALPDRTGLTGGLSRVLGDGGRSLAGTGSVLPGNETPIGWSGLQRRQPVRSS